jgi:predicted nuclease of predicted toxin-antitoxin system
MKLLLDTCVAGKTADALRASGHDVIWTGDELPDPGDEQILARAYAENRVLITLDKDFGELAVVHGEPHHGIVRLVDFRTADQPAAIEQVLALHGDKLTGGAMVTVQPGLIRIRPADD